MKSRSRRNFLRTFTAAAALPLSFGHTAFALPSQSPFTVLFQGDSITDGNRGRDRDPNHIMGHGYAFSVASELGARYPERNLRFINKGVSGDKISDLLLRWKNDAVDLRPDLISILAGINDILGFIHRNEEFDGKVFEEQYSQLIQSTRTSLPNTAIVLGEPFILPVGMVKNDVAKWDKMVSAARAIIKNISYENNAVFLPFQEVFTEACRKVSPEYWIWDGIHPTYSGHGLMKELWLSEVGKKIKKIKN